MAAEEIGAARRDRVEPVRPASAADEKFRHGQDQRRPQDVPSGRAARPYAPLVAQLIATTLGLGQTRPRRRAAVSEAVAAYRRVRQKPGRSYGVV